MNKTIEELKTAKTQAEKDIFKIVSELEVGFGISVEGIWLSHLNTMSNKNQKSTFQVEIDLRVL